MTIETGTNIWRAVAGIDRALNINLSDAITDALSRSGHVTCYRNTFDNRNLSIYKQCMEGDP